MSEETKVATVEQAAVSEGIEPPPELLAPPLRAADSLAAPAVEKPLPSIAPPLRPPPAPAPAPVVPKAVPMPRPRPAAAAKTVPITNLHLGLSFLGGLLLVLGLAFVCLAVWAAAMPPADTKTLGDLSDTATGERVRLGELTVVQSLPTNPYHVDAPMLVLEDNQGHHINLLDTSHVSLPLKSDVYGLSARVDRAGREVVLRDAYQDTDAGSLGAGGALALVLGIVALVALRRSLVTPR